MSPHCQHCGGPLERFEGHAYCPDCTAYRPADEPLYRDDTGALYRPAGRVPWCELVAGDRYAVPGETAVHVRTAAPTTPTLWAEYPAIGRGLHNRPVILLERVDDDPDRIIDLVYDEDLPF
jgi:hypothetical protein